MAKISKPKARTGPSLHSRAAKRASSPSLNLDKSVTSLPRPSSPDPSSSSTAAAGADLSNRDKITRKVLDIVHRTTTANNGISKKQNRADKRGNRTKQQKKRIEMGRERGEALMEILEKKTIESKKREKVVKERSSDWETINSKTQFEALQSVEV